MQRLCVIELYIAPWYSVQFCQLAAAVWCTYEWGSHCAPCRWCTR